MTQISRTGGFVPSATNFRDVRAVTQATTSPVNNEVQKTSKLYTAAKTAAGFAANLAARDAVIVNNGLVADGVETLARTGLRFVGLGGATLDVAAKLARWELTFAATEIVAREAGALAQETTEKGIDIATTAMQNAWKGKESTKEPKSLMGRVKESTTGAFRWLGLHILMRGPAHIAGVATRNLGLVAVRGATGKILSTAGGAVGGALAGPPGAWAGAAFGAAAAPVLTFAATDLLAVGVEKLVYNTTGALIGYFTRETPQNTDNAEIGMDDFFMIPKDENDEGHTVGELVIIDLKDAEEKEKANFSFDPAPETCKGFKGYDLRGRDDDTDDHQGSAFVVNMQKVQQIRIQRALQEALANIETTNTAQLQSCHYVAKPLHLTSPFSPNMIKV